jgi:hypothetical protein
MLIEQSVISKGLMRFYSTFVALRVASVGAENSDEDNDGGAGDDHNHIVSVQ